MNAGVFRRLAAAPALALAMVAVPALGAGTASAPAPAYGPGYGPGPGMMGGYGAGPWQQGRGAGPGYGPSGAWGGGWAMGPGAMAGYGGWGMGPGGWGMGPGMMRGYGGWGGGPCAATGYGPGLAALRLSDAQIRKIDAIREAEAKRQWALMASMHEAMLSGWRNFDRADIDVDAAMKTAKAMSDLRLQMLRNRLETAKQIEGVLTKAQRDELGGMGPWGW